MLYSEKRSFSFIAFLALFFSILHFHYFLSIAAGVLLLNFVIIALIVNYGPNKNKYLYAMVLIYGLVSMDLGPFSESTWSSAIIGSGFINTPLTKVFLLFLAVHIALISRNLRTYINFVLLLVLIVLAEGINVIFLGTALSTWSMLIVLFILFSYLLNETKVYLDAELVHFVLRVSIYAIGIRISVYLLTNLFGYTDYLSFGQRPVVSSLYVLSSVLLKKKLGLIDFVLVSLNLIPIGKGDLIHLLIVSILLPRMFVVFAPIFGAAILIYSNELIFIKLAELALILGFDDIPALLGVQLSLSDAGSIGTRISELKTIISSMMAYPHSFLFGLNGIGITTQSVASLGGDLSFFDYSEIEFNSGIIINVHGFYNKLLYTTGGIGIFLYLFIMAIYVWRGYFLINYRVNSKIKSAILSLLIGVALIFQLYLSPEIAIVYFLLTSAFVVGRLPGN
jgi:hypothetical protein